MLSPQDGGRELLLQPWPFPINPGPKLQTGGGQADTSTLQSNCQASEACHKRSGFQGCLRPSVTLIVESHTNESGALVQTTRCKYAPVYGMPFLSATSLTWYSFVCDENGLLQFNEDGSFRRITILGEICFLSLRKSGLISKESIRTLSGYFHIFFPNSDSGLLHGKHWKYGFVRSHITKWQAKETECSQNTHTPRVNVQYSGLKLFSQDIARREEKHQQA